MQKKYAIHGMSPSQLIGNYQGVQLVGTSCLPSEIRQTISKKHPDIRHFDSLEELLENEPMDVISICSGQSAYQDILKAQEMGLTVVAEKPLVQNTSELKELSKLNLNSPIYTLTPLVFHPCLQAIRELVSLGELGEVIHIHCEKSYTPTDDNNTFSGIQHLMPSLYWGFLLGLGQPEVINVSGNIIGSHNSMVMHAFLKFPSQATLSISLNSLKPVDVPEWTGEKVSILGTKGNLEALDLESIKVIYRDGEIREENGFDINDNSVLCQHFIDSLTHDQNSLLSPQQGFDISELALNIGKELVF
ncbi:MAG: Gfo/Idh/MocA family oxidoreductase [Planctomycetes bacterium]|nr:Gfo/Idh/MocA family oxidoreductase [Planctomycetota bacterium]